MGSSTNPSTELARAVVTALVEGGVREVVLAPGSRNAPLSFAVLDAERAGLLRLHTRIDERSAGFLALGLTKTGSRAAVMCTSGTAVANLHPAVLEAAHAGVPLLVVSADRPARLRGTGANQTTEQVGIFGGLVGTHDIATPADLAAPAAALAETAAGLAAGPAHWNIQLDDPLTPTDRWAVPSGLTAAARPTGAPPRPDEEALLAAILDGRRTVVVAGDDAGPLARVLAERSGSPLLAEPSSGARTGTHALRTYRLLLGSDLADRIERVVVLGHPTLSRPVARLLARGDVEILAVPTRGVWPTPSHRVDGWLDGDAAPTRAGRRPESTVAAGWLEEWQEADRSVAGQLDRLLAAEEGLTPLEVVGAVARALPPGGQLVVGASNPIRDLDLMVPRPGADGWAVGARRKVLASRGLAGIDGLVSTAIGAALGRDSSRDLALTGDVTFLHDANGLILGPDEPRPDLTIVVVNDDGGSIFATLEQGDPTYADAFERLFGTPHGVDLAALCAATRTPHLKVTSLPELEQALASPNGGIEVIEAVVGRADRRGLEERIRALRPG
ncbi:2-succinyl-5-enolpyruvyl-6-hydroxy-3-cyclohexene-1-carboxylic-acid synthase [Nocardioides sp. BP30]|uniref:2-succinyl-5-enolpyruvyl-6-hydroxy-3- cyclohexene-1-carboxylic-acid synthase n=1 Tax=Nocardioides sp. BP30 TaxID=3036374 RepID=UPI002468B3A3|nr:2-succinyl-5-enolpyruvyl-6-hydroxy-3-cyclohexene-1-carboxylic-acid synthase [Nocardioides sp. BP30]WGL52937.1 2-succinyl-5-enolpyruvyl-6-hydroxy-3-cyclohexene-1-carboxylic-acid synthase [Nocardioides sp. BP30]